MIEERRYSKRELARLYWPETKNIKSALKNLRQDIKGCPELVAALQRTHWNVNRHSYSAEQVRLILKYLCEPKTEKMPLQACLTRASSVSDGDGFHT